VPVPISAEAAVPKPKPFVFVANTLVPSQITKPTEPKGISYPCPPAVFILTISLAVVLADTLLLIT